MCVNLVTENIAVSEIRESKGRSGIMKNNKDSTEIKKAIKDSEVIRNLLINFYLLIYVHIMMYQATLTWKAGWQNFLKIFFFSTVGGGIKKNTIILTKAQREWEKTSPPLLLLLIVYESFHTMSLSWSVCCCGTRHLKRLAVQWPVCAVDQKQDRLSGWE